MADSLPAADNRSALLDVEREVADVEFSVELDGMISSDGFRPKPPSSKTAPQPSCDLTSTLRSKISKYVYRYPSRSTRTIHNPSITVFNWPQVKFLTIELQTINLVYGLSPVLWSKMTSAGLFSPNMEILRATHASEVRRIALANSGCTAALGRSTSINRLPGTRNVLWSGASEGRSTALVARRLDTLEGVPSRNCVLGSPNDFPVFPQPISVYTSSFSESWISKWYEWNLLPSTWKICSPRMTSFS